MTKSISSSTKRSIYTASGYITYTEQGMGPSVLFVDGVSFDNDIWSTQLAAISDLRRVVVVDLLAHVDREIAPNRDMTMINAKMLGEFMNALEIDQTDLVANDSARAVAQVFAAVHPGRIRSLTLMACNTCHNHQPEAGKSFIGLVAKEHLRGWVDATLTDEVVHLSPEPLGCTDKHLDKVATETLGKHRCLSVSSSQRARDRERFITTFNVEHTFAVVSLLKELDVPAVLVWEEDHAYFGVEWSHSLSRAFPEEIRRVEFEDAPILYIAEQTDNFIHELRDFWQKVGQEIN